jgi:hypothetical protein
MFCLLPGTRGAELNPEESGKIHKLLLPILDAVDKQMRERKIAFSGEALRVWNERVAFAGLAVQADPDRVNKAVELMPEMVARLAEKAKFENGFAQVPAKAVVEVLGEPKTNGCRYWPFCKWW